MTPDQLKKKKIFLNRKQQSRAAKITQSKAKGTHRTAMYMKQNLRSGKLCKLLNSAHVLFSHSNRLKSLLLPTFSSAILLPKERAYSSK